MGWESKQPDIQVTLVVVLCVGYWQCYQQACQHAGREGQSTCTARTQITHNWLKEIDNKKIVGAVLLDFSAAFDLIDHNLLLKKRIVCIMAFQPLPFLGFRAI